MEDANILPLYDRAKNDIYDDFQRLKRQRTIILTLKNKNKKMRALRYFRERYENFFWDLMENRAFDFLDEIIRNNLMYFAEKEENITLNNTIEVMLNCAQAIKDLNITNITFVKNEDSFA